jgi:hypothetical protein
MHPQQPSPHDVEIALLVAQLDVILRDVSDEDWSQAYPLAQAYVDGLEALLRRLEHN